MNLYLMIAILIVNAIAIGIVYQFIKKLDNKQKLLFFAISIAIIYILISITYWISGFGIEEKIHEETKNFIIYLFVPVNMILFVPYIALQYVKLKTKQIKQEKFLKKLIIVSLLLIVVLIVEYFYFRNVQNNINIINNKVEQNNTINNETISQNIISNEEVNTIEANVIQNETIENEVLLNKID